MVGFFFFYLKKFNTKCLFLVSTFALTAVTASFEIKINPVNAVILNMKERKLFI